MGRLVLDSKPDETFVLFDNVSGHITRLKVFYRERGNLSVAFDAPRAVEISREKQGNVKNGDKRTD